MIGLDKNQLISYAQQVIGFTKPTNMFAKLSHTAVKPTDRTYTHILYVCKSSKALSGSELMKNVKISGPGGQFRIKSLPTGTYLFKVAYAGYAEQEVSVHINEGVLTRVEIPLTKPD